MCRVTQRTCPWRAAGETEAQRGTSSKAHTHVQPFTQWSEPPALPHTDQVSHLSSVSMVTLGTSSSVPSSLSLHMTRTKARASPPLTTPRRRVLQDSCCGWSAPKVRMPRAQASRGSQEMAWGAGGDRQQPELPGVSTLSPDPAWPSARNQMNKRMSGRLEPGLVPGPALDPSSSGGRKGGRVPAPCCSQACRSRFSMRREGRGHPGRGWASGTSGRLGQSLPVRSPGLPRAPSFCCPSPALLASALGPLSRRAAPGRGSQAPRTGAQGSRQRPCGDEALGPSAPRVPPWRGAHDRFPWHPEPAATAESSCGTPAGRGLGGYAKQPLLPAARPGAL